MKRIIAKSHYLLIGIFLTLVIIMVYSFGMRQNTTSLPETSPDVIRFIPIGDSYTIGNGARVEERWPNLLVESLRRDGIKIDLIQNPAVSGYDVRDAIELELPLFEKDKPDFGTLFIGTNDSFRGRDLKLFKADLVELLDRMQGALTNKNNLVVITIPNYALYPGAIDFKISDEEIENYNMIIREEAEKRGLKIVDLYRNHQLAGVDFFISDGIHPNARGIKVWHDAIYPVVKDILLGY